jgi:hypothetical protein
MLFKKEYLSMSLISRTHIDPSTTKALKWDADAACFVTSQRVGNDFKQTPVTQPFALDCWRAQHGYEQWLGDDGARTRHTALAPVSSPLPAKPDGKATAIYSIPVYSAELGGERELIIRGEAVVAALSDLFDVIEQTIANIADKRVPVVSVETVSTDSFGQAPKFNVDGAMPRPAKWPAPIVTF